MDPHSHAAQAAVAALFDRDIASRKLGMEIVACGPGFSRVTMRVQPEMLQGHGTCHGGFVFMLADSAFAFACNSHGPTTVAASCTIDFLAPVRQNDDLTAEATEQATVGRSGIYQIRVINQKGETVAIMHCRSHRVTSTGTKKS